MEKHKWIKFKAGNLKDLTIFSTDEYVKNYDDDNTDVEMMDDIANIPIKNKTIFDVGAFNGLSSLVFANLAGEKGKVVAFEPNQFNRERISKNYSENKELAKKISIYPFGLSNANGQTRMVISSDVEGPSSTSRLVVAHAKIASENLPSGFKETTVEIKKLDDFVLDTKIVPDIIKVDIEGAEHLMLLGSLNTLKKYHPILYIEIHSEFCAIKCYDILKSCNYDIEIINEEPDNRIMIKATLSNGEKVDYKGHFESGLLIESIDKKMKNLSKKITAIEELLNKSIEEKGKLLAILEKKENDLISNEEQLNKIKTELDNIYLSKSWNMTKPLRKLRGIFKRSDKI